jgi:hypothetical protein
VPSLRSAMGSHKQGHLTKMKMDPCNDKAPTTSMASWQLPLFPVGTTALELLSTASARLPHEILRINAFDRARLDPDLIRADLGQFDRIWPGSGAKTPAFLGIHEEMNEHGTRERERRVEGGIRSSRRRWCRCTSSWRPCSRSSGRRSP